MQRGIITVFDATSRQTIPDNNTGTPCPTLSDKSVGSLTSPANHVALRLQETGPGKLQFAITVELRYLELSSSQGKPKKIVRDCEGL